MKKILASLLVISILFTGCTVKASININDETTSNVANNETTINSDSASKNVVNSDSIDIKNVMSLWQDNAKILSVLEDYVKDVTDENSKNFIPVKDRIAVFDMDGTLLCEKAPYYSIWQMFVERALNDDTYQAPEDVKKIANQI